MGTERHPGARLRLLRDTTTDAALRRELGTLLSDVGVPVAPSRPLAAEIAACLACATDDGMEQLCPSHEAQWRREARQAERAWRPMASEGQDVVRDALGTEGAELLAALHVQTTALRLVCEAYARGAARLPDGVVRAVREAERLTPAFLRGGSVPQPVRRSPRPAPHES